ncbi:MAG: mechanosensitive ion channel family protein [Oscillatoria sp. PMC 1051.18]|uniref:mechanosensitive ion channel family protein n=1 Tax=Oscillatoria salina TaxID=331517 RepID=UPI0013B5CBD9|nr:mechanosensitive ion channel family protein [Oscillatoria salina]MBZ8180381.1 mechanosensitive ion channel family protein [Oscillatoria salina IIICB1]MEC4893343.1 mechanosensitive ion channel family protein [Oscillatoria sp. PMC 1050.18]MEC5028720.1 mechanosensitive ion channel family protein [Oscillatoria sp. PMC 1051.18]NET89710.1 mechanosensitive ion channel family protein [Kamptonema sp. SIO1D9]
MSDIVQTIYDSLKEVLGSTVKVIPALVTAAILLALTRFFAELAKNVSSRIGERAIRSRSLQLLLSKTAYVTAWVIGVLVAAVIAFPGLELGDIIATLGLGSVAIGFAFQDIFKNFLAGVLLLLQEPFSIGDQIIVDNYEGTVEQIDIRTTKIRTYQGERVILPNATVFTSAVQVRTAFVSRRTDLAVGVDYNTPLAQAKQILQNLLTKVEGILEHPTPEIDLVGFGDSSIDFVVRYWTKPQQAEVRRVQTQAILAIKKAFDKADISIPYPIRTLYYYNQEKFNDYLPASPDRESEN